MKLSIYLYAIFRNGRFMEEQREFMDDITLDRVVFELGIAEKDIGMVLVNGLCYLA